MTKLKKQALIRDLTSLCSRYNITTSTLGKIVGELVEPVAVEEVPGAREFWGDIAGVVKQIARKKIF